MRTKIKKQLKVLKMIIHNKFFKYIKQLRCVQKKNQYSIHRFHDHSNSIVLLSIEKTLNIKDNVYFLS